MADDGDADGGAADRDGPGDDADPHGSGDDAFDTSHLTADRETRVAAAADRFIRAVELVAAWVFAGLFAVGVMDLLLKIADAIRSGSITEPETVITFIDTGLLLLIIVEVYHTVIAYTQESSTRQIVRLVVYTGVIAMVRKTIIFRTEEYSTAQDAMLAAGSYTVLIFGLIGLLYVEHVYG